MLIDLLANSDLVILNSLLLLIILFMMFKWFFNQVRDICKEPEGFIKFGQVTFILLSWSCFIVILIYYIFNKTEVNAVDIVFTVVVGFLGTIIGMFFSKEALESLKGKLKERDKAILDKAKLLRETRTFISELKNIK